VDDGDVVEKEEERGKQVRVMGMRDCCLHIPLSHHLPFILDIRANILMMDGWMDG